MLSMNLRLSHALSFCCVFLCCYACKSTQAIPDRAGKQTLLVIEDVHVITGTIGGEVIRNATVIIDNGIITSVNGNTPRNAKVINGRGKWLIAGMIDMHVHLPSDFRLGQKIPTGAASVFFNTQDILTPFIANGVTTVFELSAKAEHFAQRNDIAKGAAIGPRIALAALMNGGQGLGTINTAADGRQAVRSAKAEGYEFIKVYSALNIETYQAIIDESEQQGMKTLGHIPNAFRGKLEDAFISKLGMVAHAEELSKHTTQYNADEAVRFAKLLKAHDIWLSPTLTTMEWIARQAISLDEISNNKSLKYVHPLLQSKWLTANSYNRNTSPERVAYFKTLVNFHKLLVKACKDEGVPIVTGTDTGTSGLIAGFSLHDELESLVDAGLTPKEALASATRLPSEWLGIDKLVGTIEPGKRADLVLLDANPLEDISATRRINSVICDGRLLNTRQLEQMLKDLAKKNERLKPQYDWNKFMGK